MTTIDFNKNFVKSQADLPRMIETAGLYVISQQNGGLVHSAELKPTDPQPTPEMVMAYITCRTACGYVCGFARKHAWGEWPTDRDAALTRAMEIIEQKHGWHIAMGYAYLVKEAVQHAKGER